MKVIPGVHFIQDIFRSGDDDWLSCSHLFKSITLETKKSIVREQDVSSAGTFRIWCQIRTGESPQWPQQQSPAKHLSPPQGQSSHSRPISADPGVQFGPELRKHLRRIEPQSEGHLAGAWIYLTCCRWNPLSCAGRILWWQTFRLNLETSVFQLPPILWPTSEALGYTIFFWNDHSIFRNDKSILQNFFNRTTTYIFLQKLFTKLQHNFV